MYSFLVSGTENQGGFQFFGFYTFSGFVFKKTKPVGFGQFFIANSALQEIV